MGQFCSDKCLRAGRRAITQANCLLAICVQSSIKCSGCRRTIAVNSEADNLCSAQFIVFQRSGSTDTLDHTLQILDLSFVRGLNDAAIRDILSPPKDSRPGLADSKTRLRDLKTLKLAGTDITDVALRYITQALPNLIHLDLSSCQRITDAGVAQIGTSPTAIGKLVELNLSACRLVSEFSLEHLAKCEQLIWLDLRHVPLVPTQAVIKFAAESKHDLCVKDIKLVEKRRPQKATQVTTSSSLGGMGSVSSWND